MTEFSWDCVLWTLTLLHTAFYIQFKRTASGNSQQFCKAHFIPGLYKDFYILYSCFWEVMFIITDNN